MRSANTSVVGKLKLRFERLSLRRKLILLVSAASLFVVSLFTFANFVLELEFFRNRLFEEYRTTGRMIASNLEAAVAFEDSRDSADILSVLSERQFVEAAGVYLKNGTLLASYERENTSEASIPPSTAESALKANSLIINEIVWLDGSPIGNVVIAVELGEIRSFFLTRSTVMLGLLVIAISLAIFLSARIGTAFSKPVLDLAKTAHRITDAHDFSTRHKRKSSDEVGKLVDAFNEMMSEIERRDSRIREAKERAEASSKAKEDFLSVISHELRTPLNPVIGYVDVLLKKRLDGDDQKQLGLIKRYAEHLQGLIDDILDYSRIERGVFNTQENAVDFQQICRNVVELLEKEADAKGLQLRYTHCLEEGQDEIDEELYIKSDRKRLQQILLNLVTNSLKFTKTGSVHIRSRLLDEKDEKVKLRIEVEDTGKGIKQTEREKIFEPFTQFEDSLTRQHGGLGLGLAITRKIVDAMGGVIDFRSEEGIGSCFWFEFPTEKTTKEETEPRTFTPKVASYKQSGRILLVDDQLVNRELGETLLSDSGHSVVCAKDGFEAIELAKEESFSLIIMDIKMPKMDGYETAQRIRQMEGDKQRTPIIALTAHVTSQGDMECLNAGMDGYLSKPINTEKLESMLSKWLPRNGEDA